MIKIKMLRIKPPMSQVSQFVGVGVLAGLICWYVLVQLVESQVWLAVCGDSASHGTGPVYT